MLSFNFDDCTEVDHEGVVHAIPIDDCADHDIPNCTCGAEELRFGGTLIAVVHKAWDRRDLVDRLFSVDTPKEAHELRKEYHKVNTALFHKGLLDKKGFFTKWAEFEDTFENIFRAN